MPDSGLGRGPGSSPGSSPGGSAGNGPGNGPGDSTGSSPGNSPSNSSGNSLGNSQGHRSGSGPVWALEGVVPQVAPDAWVAPTAAVIGDVILGARSSVWFHCVLRGDTNRITVGAGTNVQDGSILHVNPAVEHACVIGADVTIGHAAIVHACTLHDRAFVGMGATVLDGAVIESGGMLAAGGVLAPGKRIGAGELWAGVPARKVRDMPGDERERNHHIALHYQERAARFRTGLISTT